jgi:hypothetical protein
MCIIGIPVPTRQIRELCSLGVALRRSPTDRRAAAVNDIRRFCDGLAETVFFLESDFCAIKRDYIIFRF